jgi:uncharacterized membrane protein YiaA
MTLDEDRFIQLQRNLHISDSDRTTTLFESRLLKDTNSILELQKRATADEIQMNNIQTRLMHKYQSSYIIHSCIIVSVLSMKFFRSLYVIYGMDLRMHLHK